MSNTEKIQQMLDALADFVAQRDALNLEKERLLDEAMPPEVKQALRDIEIEFDGKAEVVDEKIQILEDGIRRLVIIEGSSVSGEYMQAVYNKGRVSWDGKRLSGYAQAHPEIKEFQKFGDPYVSMRRK